MSNNLLIGAISSNYTPTDIRTWVVSSKNTNSHRVLLLYNSLNDELIQYLRSHDVDVVIPEIGRAHV